MSGSSREQLPPSQPVKGVRGGPQTTALPPEQTLGPIGALFAKVGNENEFHQQFAGYVRDLLGATAVITHRIVSETMISQIAFSAARGDTSLNALLSKQIEDVVRDALSIRMSQRATVVINKRQHRALVVPFFLKGGEPICLCAVLPPERIAFTDPCFSILHLATQFYVQRELFLENGERAAAFQQATLLVEMFSLTNDAPTLKRALFTLANELKRFFACDRVAIGTGSRKSCRVQAVSGSNMEESRNLGHVQLGAALKEAIAVGKAVIWPRQEVMPKDLAVSANHDDLLHSFNAGRILVVPLTKGGGGLDRDEEDGFSSSNVQMTGALALIWRKEAAPIEKIQYNLINACQPHVSALVWMLKRSKGGPVARFVHYVFRGSLAKRITIFSVLAVIAGILAFPITYRVAADCRLEPVQRRIVAAPFDNSLHRAYVKPGMLVEKGQVLAELEGREIRMGLAEAIAQQNAALKKRDNMMVQQNAANMQMAQFEADRLTLEVKRLQFRNDNLVIRSPIDGVILTGDLERSEGVPVSTGQKLFEIASLEKMEVEIYIPETEMRHVFPGAEVTLRLESRSDFQWSSKLEEIHPVSEIYVGENVFIGDAILENPDGELRPGMKGVVRIESGKRAVGWILFHRLWEYLRLEFW